MRTKHIRLRRLAEGCALVAVPKWQRTGVKVASFCGGRPCYRTRDHVPGRRARREERRLLLGGVLARIKYRPRGAILVPLDDG